MPDIVGEVRPLSGIRFIDAIEGNGGIAERGNCVYTHYTAWRANGRKVESSHDPLPGGTPGQPVAFTLGIGQVMRGWDIGVMGMRVGGQRRLLVPADLAYGERGRPPLIPSGASLVFDMELVDVRPAPANGGCPVWRPA